jgi:hypothetical protein
LYPEVTDKIQAGRDEMQEKRVKQPFKRAVCRRREKRCKKKGLALAGQPLTNHRKSS